MPISRLSENQLASFRQKHLGFVFQSYNLLPNLTATENVAMPLLFRGVPRQQREAAARKLLTRVGLAHRLDHFPRQMSGGQQQRAGIARAFIARPDVVFADEPTGNLDSKTTVEIMEMICTFARDYHQTIILVTHDPEMASYADRIVTLIDGEIVSNQLNQQGDVPNMKNNAFKRLFSAAGGHPGCWQRPFLAALADGGSLYVTGYTVTDCHRHSPLGSVTKGTDRQHHRLHQGRQGRTRADPVALDIAKLDDSFMPAPPPRVDKTVPGAGRPIGPMQVELTGVQYKGAGQKPADSDRHAPASPTPTRPWRSPSPRPWSTSPPPVRLTPAAPRPPPEPGAGPHGARSPAATSPSPWRPGQEVELTVTFRNLAGARLQLKSPVATFTPSDALSLVRRQPPPSCWTTSAAKRPAA